jgi:hypothetical protein
LAQKSHDYLGLVANACNPQEADIIEQKFEYISVSLKLSPLIKEGIIVALERKTLQRLP